MKALLVAAALTCPHGWAPHDYAVDRLTNEYKEQLTAIGISEPHGHVVEFWAGDKTWTVIMTDTDGCSTMLSSGRDWMEVPTKTGTGL